MKHNMLTHKLVKGLHLFVIAALLAGLALSLLPVPVAHAATFIVDTTDDTDDATPGNGVCADSSGDCSLRAAITEANALAGPDIITLPAGTYTLTITIAGRPEEANAEGDLDITDDLTINGASAANTIVQAGTDDTNGIDRVFHIPSPAGDGVTVTFNDLTIRYGYLSGTQDGDVDDGAAIHNETGATVNINDCIITENTVADGDNDAAIANQGLDGGGTININNCTISDNSSDDDGGGVFNLQQTGGTSTINIANSTIFKNTTEERGGGVYNEGGTVTVSSSLITFNEAEHSDRGDGGGIANRKGGTLIVSNSTFSGNIADHDGGAVYVGVDDSSETQATITTSTFSGNTAGNNGGGVHVEDDEATVTLTNVTISSNTTEERGGGVYNESGTVTISNSTISNNVATDSIDGDGGGVANCQGGTLIVSNSSFSGNICANDGGAVYVDDENGDDTQVTITGMVSPIVIQV